MANPRTKIITPAKAPESHWLGGLLLATLLVLTPFGSATAADSNDARVITKISGQTLKQILESDGYTALALDQDGDMTGKVDGIPFIVIIAEDHQSMMFRYAASGTKANLRKVNDWNRAKKYSRGVIDDDGDPMLELDLDLEGGVTVARVKNYFLTAIVSMKAFREDVCK
ncbi:MAG: hypothetical protein RJB26_333 [Pseudomonadota bacterium]|jgi:hypothetical protein